MKADAFTTHGFRSSFRDWAGEATEFPREIAEAALAHAIGDKTEAAYRRGDALAKRCKLMDAWAVFIEPKYDGQRHQPADLVRTSRRKSSTHRGAQTSIEVGAAEVGPKNRSAPAGRVNHRLSPAERSR
jgi:hypothetical protein